MLANEGRSFEAIRLDDEGGWLDLRREGVGGSDVAAVMGVSPWVSTLEVWMDKTGLREHEDISGRESVAMGAELEETVLDMYRRRHPDRRATRSNAVLRSVGRPWAQASLDGVVRDPDAGWGVLEIKTGSRESEWADGVPLHYLCQVTHYMSVTGYDYADVAALVGDHGLHYHEYRVERDDEDVRAIESAVDSFWNDFVVPRIMPANVSALPSEGKAIWEMYRTADGDVPEDGEAASMAEELDRLNAKAKELSSRRTELSNALKRAVGEHKGILTDDYVVTWVRSEKRDSGIRVRRRD